jgi:hypothetical protein
MTHPDDEISICAWIRRLTQSGNQVYISWTHNKPIREKEARAVAELLGVPQDNLFFHHATDGSVCDEILDLIPKFQAMMDSVKPDRVCCGAFEQGHLDHDSTNLLVNLTFKGPILEIPFYHDYRSGIQRFNRFSDPTGEEVLHLTPEEVRFKKDVAKQYPSQNIWRLLLIYEVWQACQLKRICLAKSERMRFQRHRTFSQPNHPQPLASKIKKCPKWKRWKTSLRLTRRGLPKN